MNSPAARLTLWGRLNSFNVQKVLFLCEELHIDVDRIDAGMAYGVNHTEHYLQMNPNGLVPTLSDEGYLLWESHAILRYLARKFDLQGSWYEGDIKRVSKVDQWLDWTNTTCWPPMRSLFWGLVRQTPQERNLRDLEASRVQMLKMWNIVDRELGHSPFIAGQSVSLADIPLSLIAYRWFNLPIERADFKNVDRWYLEMSNFSGFKKYSSDPLS